jgi:hypothetical protein
MSREPLTITLVEALFHLATGTTKTAEQYEREYHIDPLRLEAAANPQVIDFLASLEKRTAAQQARLDTLRQLKADIDDEQQRVDDAERAVFDAAIRGQITITGRRGSPAHPDQWGDSEVIPVAYFYNPIATHLPSNTLQPDFYSTTARGYPKLKSLPSWNDCRLRFDDLRRIAAPPAPASRKGQKKMGRPQGTGIDDEQVLKEMHRGILAGTYRNSSQAAKALAGHAEGGGRNALAAMARIKRKYDERKNT